MKVTMIVACTADGFIGRTSAPGSMSTSWTSPEDKRFYLGFIKQAGVMVMGSRTFATIGHGLPGRMIYVFTGKPESLQGIEGVKAVSGDPQALVNHLEQQGHAELAVCGGSTIYHLFLKAELIDELYLTIEPLLFGSGIPLLSQEFETRMRLLEAKPLNDSTMLLHYSLRES